MDGDGRPEVIPGMGTISYGTALATIRTTLRLMPEQVEDRLGVARGTWRRVYEDGQSPDADAGRRIVQLYQKVAKADGQSAAPITPATPAPRAPGSGSSTTPVVAKPEPPPAVAKETPMAKGPTAAAVDPDWKTIVAGLVERFEGVAALAKKLGCSEPPIRGWLRGSTPRKALAEKLLDLCVVKPGAVTRAVVPAAARAVMPARHGEGHARKSTAPALPPGAVEVVASAPIVAPGGLERLVSVCQRIVSAHGELASAAQDLRGLLQEGGDA